MPVLFDPPEQRWYCPACGQLAVTREARPHTQYHQCPALKGVLAPFVAAGVKASLRVNEREDFVGGELVQTDGYGRPVMSVQVLRDDGEDCVVLAPTATMTGTALNV